MVIKRKNFVFFPENIWSNLIDSLSYFPSGFKMFVGLCILWFDLMMGSFRGQVFFPRMNNPDRELFYNQELPIYLKQ